jgi:phosphohistidine phosphatase
MKNLCLIRHAKSDWGNEDLEDIDRPLNARGYADAKTMSLRLKDSGIYPQAILSSTAIRAASTALIFGRTYGTDTEQIRFTPHLYEAGVKQFLEVLKGMPEEWNNVFVFGHNPTISEAASHLSGESGLNLPTCGIVLLEVMSEKWLGLSKCRLLLNDFPKNAAL